MHVPAEWRPVRQHDAARGQHGSGDADNGGEVLGTGEEGCGQEGEGGALGDSYSRRQGKTAVLHSALQTTSSLYAAHSSLHAPHFTLDTTSSTLHITDSALLP